MAQKPLSQMADTGYENAPEHSGYVLAELKAFAQAASAKIEAAATMADLSAVWRSCENMFAQKSEVNSALQVLSNKVEDLSEVKTNMLLIVNQFSKYALQSEMVSALSFLSAQADRSKTYTADVTITPEEMLALNATPVVLVPAAGEGKIIEVKRVEFFLDFETTAYASLQDLSLEYSSGGQILLVPSAGWLDGASDQRRCAHHKDVHEVGVNEAVALKMLVGEILAGDSPLKVRVDYRIVDVLV